MTAMPRRTRAIGTGIVMDMINQNTHIAPNVVNHGLAYP